MASVVSAVGKEHRKFINDIVADLNANGVRCGWTDYPTPKAEEGIIWPAHVIAKKKEGLRGHLPFGYDTSKEGVLFRMYDFLNGAASDPTVRAIVEQKITEYFQRVQQIAAQEGLEVMASNYDLSDNLRHGESIRPRRPSTLFG